MELKKAGANPRKWSLWKCASSFFFRPNLFPMVSRAAIGILLMMLGAAGCSSTPTTSSLSLVDTQGNHPSGWINTHSGFAATDVSICKSCHGDDLTGGISNTSCFGNTANCHHGTIPGWTSPAVHGASAKQAPGLSTCRICHGNNFSGGGSGVTCFTCHGVSAPHPRKPWLSSPGNTHVTTNPLNAPVCAQCHFSGSPNNPANHPATPAPAGTPPGCFNSTLCHGTEDAPHALGAAWRLPTSASFHGITAKQDLTVCQACHGTPGTIRFDGGVAPTACSAAGCHPSAQAHPVPWFAAPQPFPNFVASHRNSANRSVACSICHKVDGPGAGPNPSAPSCFTDRWNGNTCHASGPGQPNHLVPFLESAHTAVAQAGFNSNCSICHNVTGTSPISSAPPCTTCHQVGSPLTMTNCTSCHAQPPAGTAYPDITGAHLTAHSLPGITGICTSCHNGLGSGTRAHYDRANARPGMDALRVPPGDVAILSTFNAKSGAAAFNPGTLTCSQVSCHGGLAAPNWRTGTIDVNSDAGCRLCHTLGTASGVPERNSPFSGRHGTHLTGLGSAGNAACTECHSMTLNTTGAKNHFAFLTTPQLEGPAADTLAPSGGTYNAQTKTCTLTCHSQLHTAFPWSGGANHSVPYQVSAHTSATQSGFDANCKACHAVTGSSPVASAPACTVCHQAGSPLTLTNCTSCHAKPPAGGAYPNILRKHPKHNALTGVTGVCTTCHTGLDFGTPGHYARANARPGLDALRVPPGDVAFLAAFNGKFGAAAFDIVALTCANVSCHGGLSAPSWDTGTINVNTDAGCKQCHILGTASGVPESNSPFSGLHTLHVTGLGSLGNALCTDCHDMTLQTTGAQNHFQFLSTPQLEGPARQTVAPLGVAGNYNSTNQTCGTFTCHGQDHISFPWAGGASHSVPFPSTAHTSVTQSGFDSNCKACHAVTGTSPVSSAPLCTMCHTAGSPLTLTNCTSCHVNPPNGSTYPNIAGAHLPAHGLPGVTGVCNTCHNGLNSGTQAHYDRANARPGKNALRVPPGDAAILSTYNAKTGASSFNSSALTCSNVSCHGGQTTPNWQTGSINVNTQCTSCHAYGTSQFNSYNSGRHNLDEHRSRACTVCHNTTTLAVNHFTALSTTAMEGPASATIGGGSTSVRSYNAGSCSPTCHETERWTGGD